MWSTMFAFAPWHSAIEFRRYLRRFVHLFPNIRTLAGVMRTRFNQYDNLIVPIMAKLSSHGVRFHPGTRVDDLHFESRNGLRRVIALEVSRNAKTEILPLSARDSVFLTLGSMTESAVLGSTAAPPPRQQSEAGASWDLWRRLAARHPEFGNPAAFCGNVDSSKWESFTVTLDRPDFFEFMQLFTGNAAGTGGLVTLADSNWLMSIVLFHQPHFRGQPEGVHIFWGNGLFPDRPGNFVAKPMTQCSGQEILQELCGHLGVAAEGQRMLAGAICLPCLMPYITSQFMPRAPGDRPTVIPPGTANLAVMGQYCEIADDVVFTVEYSVRSAMTAVYALLGVRKKVPGVRRTDRNPFVLLRALTTVLSG
jgi:oleate hydratase